MKPASAFFAEPVFVSCSIFPAENELFSLDNGYRYERKRERYQPCLR